MEGDLLKGIRELDVDALARQETLGIELNFKELVPVFRDLKSLLVEAIDVIELNVEIPNALLDNFQSTARTFANFVGKIRDFSPQRYQNHSEDQRRKIIEGIRNYYESVIIGKDDYGFIQTVFAIKSYKDKELRQFLNKASQTKSDYEKVTTEAKKLVETLRTEVSKVGISDYAEIFHREAHRYSGFRILKNRHKEYFNIKNIFNITIGNSTIWFLVGLVVLLYGVYFAITNENLFEISSSNPKEYIPEIIRWVFFTSIWVYSFRFCFKQYLINKHLFTLNKHRENTLNSFKLLIESVSPDDVTTRSAIVLEVAKAIYEQGHTGYLNDSSADVQSTSVVEISKYLSGGK